MGWNYQFPNFNDTAVHVRKLINNYISQFITNVITYPCCNLNSKSKIKLIYQGSINQILWCFKYFFLSHIFIITSGFAWQNSNEKLMCLSRVISIFILWQGSFIKRFNGEGIIWRSSVFLCRTRYLKQCCFHSVVPDKNVRHIRRRHFRMHFPDRNVHILNQI